MNVLNKIPKLLPPELVKCMMEMGHGDELVLGDANFPAVSMGARVVRMDGIPIPAILDAVLELFPLDTYVEKPTALMQVVPGDPVVPTIWDEYRAILKRHGCDVEPEQMERFQFYQRAKTTFLVVATGEEAIYANIILKKGVIK